METKKEENPPRQYLPLTISLHNGVVPFFPSLNRKRSPKTLTSSSVFSPSSPTISPKFAFISWLLANQLLLLPSFTFLIHGTQRNSHLINDFLKAAFRQDQKVSSPPLSTLFCLFTMGVRLEKRGILGILIHPSAVILPKYREDQWKRHITTMKWMRTHNKIPP